MPPWFADPRYGHFCNDRSLLRHEIDTLAAWVDAGAPAGDPERRAAAAPVAGRLEHRDARRGVRNAGALQRSGQGRRGVSIPDTSPAFHRRPLGAKVEVRPGNRAAVHHAVVYIREPGSKWLEGEPREKHLLAYRSRRGFTTSDLLMVYTPGNSYDQWPRGMAKRIQAGSDLVLQMHYTANGKATADRTRIGVVFAKEPPKQAVLSLQMGNDRFVIPPGDPNYRVAGLRHAAKRRAADQHVPAHAPARQRHSSI